MIGERFGATGTLRFLENWFAGFYRFDGLILVLQGDFDETGGHENAAITAVAGFVYERPGLVQFTSAFGPQVAGLTKPYRTSLCNAGYEPFVPPAWPSEQREGLMDNLADVSADTALAGFVTAMTKEDYEAALGNGPSIVRLLDSPYTVCVLSMLDLMARWLRQSNVTKRVYCWFEKGAYHEAQAQDFVRRIGRDQDLAKHFGPIDGQSWIPKENVPAFCSADLLAWEWQRNVLKSPDQWTPRMTRLMGRMRAADKPIYAESITANRATMWALNNAFAKLHRD